ncbi:MAG: anion transporter [Rhodocyclaceae bacterium]|nr:anion transporter [Rhodocyclaceae bacterium]
MPAALSPDALDWGIAAIFAIVYLGMFLGGLPKLKLDRTGIALLGAIAMIGSGALDPAAAVQAIDLPTMLLLFSFMVVSAQMRLGGFYSAVTRGIAAWPLSPPQLLGALIFVAAALSAVFSNDVVCLAMTPIVARICLARGLPPLPFLVGLACAANLGSAATLIGNPQNMLIGAVKRLDFAAYSAAALPPVALSLLLLWGFLAWRLPSAPAVPPAPSVAAEEAPAFDRWQSAKGLLIATALLIVFLFTSFPREVAALIAAGLLLLSRRFHSSQVLGFVDWELLVLFAGLFVVNHAFETTGLAAAAFQWLAEQGLALHEPASLGLATILLSNLVSNVPAVMLLLPAIGSVKAAHLLALFSTFAGNLLLVGSIANLIVADLAKKDGIEIGWLEHARIGVPITVGSAALVWLWLA